MWSFESIYKPTIWGGHKIADYKGLSKCEENIGESWEISSMPGSLSVVRSEADFGLDITDILKKYGTSLLGRKNYEKFGNRFPLLVKLIDAERDLSIQVHPNCRMAKAEGLENGKTEMWYVIGAEEGARIGNGFIDKIDKERYINMVETGEIEKHIRYTETAEGMVFLIPARRIHAIGSGNLICEIQQTSDTTYRIYDYGRTDAKGNRRKLHTDKAMAALDFEDCGGEQIEPREISDGDSTLVRMSEFTVNLLSGGNPVSRNYSRLDSFVLLIVMKGSVRLESPSGCTPGSKVISLGEGELVLIPAAAAGVSIFPDGEAVMLEAYIED